jgi:hypothetical protein
VLRMRVEFLRGHVADLEQLHEAQEVIRLFLEAQKHHLASHYSADASCPGELPAVERPQFDPSQLPNPVRSCYLLTAPRARVRET